MNKISAYFFLHFAVTAWPFLNFYGSKANHEEVSFISFFFLFLAFWGVGLLICEGIRKIFRMPRERILIIYSVFIILFFSYIPFKEFLDSLHIGRTYYIYIFFSFVTLVCVYLASKFTIFQQMVYAFVVILFSCASVENLLLYFKEEAFFSHKRSTFQTVHEQNTLPYNFKKNMNVYYLLVDMYPRADVLKANLNYDNFEFVNFFKERGFIVAEKSFSNYSFTNLSLTATFEMNYPNQQEVNRKNILSSDKPALRVLRDNDYKFIIVPSPNDNLQAKDSADFTITTNKKKILSESYIKFFDHSALSIFTPLLDHLLHFGKNEFQKIFETGGKDKKFVFIHFMQFHDLVYDKNCQINKTMWRTKREPSKIVDNLPCINTFVMDSINEIMTQDPNSIILVQGDHGPYPWRKEDNDAMTSAEEFLRQYGNFSALYIPDLDKRSPVAEYLAHAPTPVNNFRVIFAYLSQISPQLLPDRAYGIAGKDKDGFPISFKDITHFSKDEGEK